MVSARFHNIGSISKIVTGLWTTLLLMESLVAYAFLHDHYQKTPRYVATIPVQSIRKYREELVTLGIGVMTEGTLRSIGTNSERRDNDVIEWRVGYKIVKDSTSDNADGSNYYG